MAFAWSLPTPPLIHLRAPLWCSFGTDNSVPAHVPCAAAAHARASGKAKRATFISTSPSQSKRALPRATGSSLLRTGMPGCCCSRPISRREPSPNSALTALAQHDDRLRANSLARTWLRSCACRDLTAVFGSRCDQVDLIEEEEKSLNVPLTNLSVRRLRKFIAVVC